nr:hypothetical protein [Saprospiraceae bacterium]
MIRTLISLIFFFIWNYLSFSQCTLEGTITSASCEQISTTFTFFDNGAPIVILSYSIYLKDNNGINTIQSGSTISGNAMINCVAPGNYRLYFVSQYSCEYYREIAISQCYPTNNFSTTNYSACLGQQVTLSCPPISGVEYNWRYRSSSSSSWQNINDNPGCFGTLSGSGSCLSGPLDASCGTFSSGGGYRSSAVFFPAGEYQRGVRPTGSTCNYEYSNTVTVSIAPNPPVPTGTI